MLGQSRSGHCMNDAAASDTDDCCSVTSDTSESSLSRLPVNRPGVAKSKVCCNLYQAFSVHRFMFSGHCAARSKITSNQKLNLYKNYMYQVYLGQSLMFFGP